MIIKILIGLSVGCIAFQTVLRGLVIYFKFKERQMAEADDLEDYLGDSPGEYEDPS